MESLNTLKFGVNAKNIKTKFSFNRQNSSKSVIDNEYSKYLLKQNEELKNKIKDLEFDLSNRLFEIPKEEDEDNIED